MKIETAFSHSLSYYADANMRMAIIEEQEIIPLVVLLYNQYESGFNNECAKFR